MTQTATLTETLENFLAKFSDDATSWSGSTDEIRDIAAHVRGRYNHEYALAGGHGTVAAIDQYAFRIPGKYNEALKTQMRALWPSLSVENKKRICDMINAMNL